MRKLGLILLLMCSLAGDFTCQEWQAMDYGIKGGSFFSVHHMEVHPVTGEMFVGGMFYENGKGQSMQGFTKWLSNQQMWDTTMFDDSYLTGMYNFSFYQNSIFGFGPLSEESFDVDGQFHEYEGPFWNYITDGPKSTVLASTIIDDDLFLVGSFNAIGEIPAYGITKYDGVNFTPYFGSFAEQSHRLDDIEEYQGDIYVVGKSLDGYPAYDWTGFAKLGENELEVAHEEFTGTFPQLWVYSLCVYQDKLYIGGRFDNDIGFTGNGIQSFDGTNMYDLNGGVNGKVFNMKVYEDELYVVGDFNRIGEGVQWWSTNGGTPCGGVAKWNGESWTCLIDDLNEYPKITELEIYNDTLYIGGSFQSLLGDTAMSMIAMLPLSTVDNVVEQEQESTLFKIYPNPSKGIINIHYEIENEGSLKILDSVGQKMKEILLSKSEKAYQLNISALPKGIYFLNIHSKDHSFSKKIILY